MYDKGFIMSKVIENALIKINKKLRNNIFEDALKIEILEEGFIVVTQDGAFSEPFDVNCTMTSDLKTFEGILAGSIKASGAFMSGKLKIEGDISTAINFAKKLNSQ